MARSNPVDSFAEHLLAQLHQADTETGPIAFRTRGKTAVFGFVDDDEWVPLFRLSRPSPSANVMNLDVQHGRSWAFTSLRGIPATLASELLGPLAYVWRLPLRAADALARFVRSGST
jgi:hypothetical protein